MVKIRVPEPQIAEEHEVLIRMKALGVCGSDIHYYTTGRIGSQIVHYPFTVGHEGAGIVEKTGDKVNRVKPGDIVAIDPAMSCYHCDQCREGRFHTCRNLKFLGNPGQAEGCLSEFIVMPETSLYPVTDPLSFDEAALSEPLSIGCYAVKQAHLQDNYSIGILGSGPIGMSVLLSAKESGAGKIFLTDKIDERLNLGTKAGATWTGNPLKQDIVTGITDKEPLLLDTVFECCGQQEAMDQAVSLLKPGGKLMIVGIPEFNRWSFSVDELRHKEISLVNIRRQLDCVQPVLDLMADQKINATQMITHRFPFEQSAMAFELVADYRDGVMKAMIEF